MDHAHEDETTETEPKATPRHYLDAAACPRVKPQFDAAAVAREYLDEMEREGRLHLTKKRSD